jgi:hypothetical protein
MKKFAFLIIILATLISSCSPRISTTIFKTYEPLDFRSDFLFLGLNDEQPESAEQIGITTVSNSSDFFTVLWKILVESREIGGNAFKITEYTTDSEGRLTITANILKVENPENYQPLALDTNYALIHIYRPNSFGQELDYDLRLINHWLGIDTLIGLSKNNFQQTIKIEEAGSYTLQAGSKTETSVSLNIELGNEYYIRSSVAGKYIVNQPRLKLINNIVGRIEFQSVGDTMKLRDYPLLRFAISGGLGCRTYVASHRIDVLQNLKIGFQYDFGVTYFFSKSKGIGFKYNGFMSNAETQIDVFINNIPAGYKQFDINTKTMFLGPTATYRLFNSKNAFLIDFGLGYMKHREKYLESGNRSKIENTKIGFCASLGYDIPLTWASAIGFQLSFVGGLIGINRTVDWNNSSLIQLNEQSNKLGRIDFSIGLRF